MLNIWEICDFDKFACILVRMWVDNAYSFVHKQDRFDREIWALTSQLISAFMSLPTSMSVSSSSSEQQREFVGNLQIFGRSGGRCHKLRASGSHCLLGKLLPLKITGWSFAHLLKSLTPHEIHAILTPAKRWPQISIQDPFFSYASSSTLYSCQWVSQSVSRS